MEPLSLRQEGLYAARKTISHYAPQQVTSIINTRTMRELIPLFLLESGDGKIEGTTRFQKLVYLAQNEPETPLSEDFQYEFYPYKYGPFSKELAVDLEDLERQGLIESNKVQTPAGARHVYRLTEGGKDVLTDLKAELRSRFEDSGLPEEMAEESLDSISAVEDVFSNMPLSNLMEYVYNHYEEMTVNSELDIA